MSYEITRHNKNRGYMRLIVWQKALELFTLACAMVPKDRHLDFKLRSQLLDSVQSISANIAEGYGRRSINEYVQHLYIALGSAAEALTRMIGLNRAGEIVDARAAQFDTLRFEVENRLLRLVDKLEQKKDQGDWIARISEDPEEYDPAPWVESESSPSLHHSTTPSLQS
jgi:four helix bundle protein